MADTVTIEDIARRSGVSTATVSRALRGLPNVSPATRDRVQRVAAELNYSLDSRASRLASGRSMTVGVAVPMAGQWFFNQLSTAIEALMFLNNYDVVRYVLVGPHEQTLLFHQLATSKRVDGLIICTVALTDEDVQLLQDLQLPVVTIEKETPHFPSVTCDNTAAAEVAVRHLIELGHQDIGLITGLFQDPMGFTIPQERTDGYLKALAEYNIPFQERLRIEGNFSAAGGAEAMAKLLALDSPPTAVFTLSDEMAIGAMKTIRDAGLRIPQDISIIGFDDFYLSEYLGLTTIRQSVSQYGETAGAILLELMENPDSPHVKSIELPTQLIIRDTTGPRP
ncbi:MAG: LacI family transcriptional regulator [Chloroflexi bacterium]|nr:LacI family transcriptional regulator [Chloroflexota bacterium]